MAFLIYTFLFNIRCTAKFITSLLFQILCVQKTRKTKTKKNLKFFILVNNSCPSIPFLCNLIKNFWKFVNEVEQWLSYTKQRQQKQQQQICLSAGKKIFSSPLPHLLKKNH